MTAPLVIHAGFHKTGTSTVQRFLAANRAVLKPHMAIALKPRLTDVLHAARGYSTWRDPLTLDKFAVRIEAFFAALPGVRKRGLIVSAEELCGHMPGREGINDYSAAPILLAELCSAARRVWDTPDLHIVLGTRGVQDWLRSSYWEHVKSSSMTEGMDDYADRIGPGADLAGMAARIADAIAPVPVHLAPLEDRHPLGPVQPLLARFDLPDSTLAQLVPVPDRNRRPPPEILDQMLHINRTVPDREARKQAKQQLLRG